MVKKFFYYLINAISVVIIIAAVFVLLSVVFTARSEAPSVFGYSAFRVVTGSMEPEIGENDMIVVKRAGASEIEVGDVISFYSADPSLQGAVNTHRVTDITVDGGSRYFTTKGDANVIEDKYPVGENNLIGKVVFTSSFLGILSRVVSNPLVFIPLILVPLLFILLSNMVRTVRLARQAAEEDEKKAVEEALQEIRRRKAERETEETPEQNTDAS